MIHPAAELRIPLAAPVVVAVLMAIAMIRGTDVAAQNISFMQRGPVASMSETDQALLRTTMKEALDSGQDGETLEWSSPDSDAKGSISLLDTHQDYGTTCRTIRAATTADGREGGGMYRLCLAEDETWRFAPLRRSSG